MNTLYKPNGVGLSSKLNKERIQLNSEEGMLESVAPSKSKFRELIEWIRKEKGLSVNQLAERSGLFVRATITEQLKKDRPNPGLDVIHGIAKEANIPEQMVMDACLGRPWWKNEKIQDEQLKEILRQYEMIRSENRSESLSLTMDILKNLIAEALEAQQRQTKTRR